MPAALVLALRILAFLLVLIYAVGIRTTRVDLAWLGIAALILSTFV
jgi:hypothetical protein